MEITFADLTPRAGSVVLSLAVMGSHPNEEPVHEAALTLWLDACDRTTVEEYRALAALTDTLRAVRRLAFTVARPDLSPNGAKRVRQSLALITGGNA